MMPSSQNPLNTYTHENSTNATFLDLEIKIEKRIFVYKLFDKREKCPFFIVLMPLFEGNIVSTIYYGSIFSEFL